MVVLPLPFPAVIIRRQKKIVAAFRAAGAISQDRATTIAALDVHEGMALRLLRRNAVVREVGENRVYLDEPSWEMREARRHRIARTILTTVLLIAVVAALWLVFR
ncbi:MAG TPA: hypothetical protein VF384_08625 [Planctomycetota bacterium]